MNKNSCQGAKKVSFKACPFILASCNKDVQVLARESFQLTWKRFFLSAVLRAYYLLMTSVNITVPALLNHCINKDINFTLSDQLEKELLIYLNLFY